MLGVQENTLFSKKKDVQQTHSLLLPFGRLWLHLVVDKHSTEKIGHVVLSPDLTFLKLLFVEPYGGAVYP